MKRKLLLFTLLLACCQLALAQVGPPIREIVKYKVKIPVRTPNVTYKVVITVEKWDGSQVVVMNETSTTNVERNYQNTYNSDTDIRNVYMDVSRNGANNFRYTFNVQGSSLIAYDRTGTWSGDNIPSYFEIPYIGIRVFQNMIIGNVDRSDPADNVYCETQPVHLKVNTTSNSNGGGGYWQYRLGGTGNFTYIKSPLGNFNHYASEYTFTLKDLFGANYRDYLNQRIEFRATSVSTYGRDTYSLAAGPDLRDKPIPAEEPDEGSNILSYVFKGATPTPQSVSAVNPTCSYDLATGLVVNFNRGLDAGENISALSIYQQLPDGSRQIFDQVSNISSLNGNSFNWQNVKGMPAGQYFVTVEAVKNGVTECDQTFYPFTVTAPDPVVIANINPQNVLCFNGSGGSITITPTGGHGNNDITQYDYSKDDGATWQPGNNVFSNLSAGSYTLKIRDKSGCVSASSQPVTITAPTAPLQITVDGFMDPKGYATADGYINTTVSNGTAPYNYSWSNGATTEDISGLRGGDFVLTVTDANGCQQKDTVPLIEPDSIKIDIDETPISCNGRSDGTLKATATGGIGSLSYRWSTGRTGTTITGLAKNSYTITVTDENNISKSRTYDLAQPDVLVAALQPHPTLCYGDTNGSVDLNVTGGTTPYTYLWNNNSTADHLEDVAAGNYQVAVTDSRNCIVHADTTVTQPAALDISPLVTPPTRYQSTDGSIDLTVSGGTKPYNYQWGNGAGTEDLTGLGDGSYTVTLTDNNGCQLEKTYVVKQPDPLTGVMQETASVLCNNAATGTLYARINGGVRPYRYVWDDGFTDSVHTNLKAGNYGVTVTDRSGVQVRLTHTITQPTALTLSLQASQVSCSGENDGTVTSTAGGGVLPYRYTWSNGATTPNLQGVNGGTYLLLLTDANNCKINGSAVVQAPNALAINSQVKEPTCDGYTDGAITLNSTGGRLPYRYTWSTGALTSNINNLPAGYYKVTLEDNSGCKISQEYTLIAPPPLTVYAGADKTLCKDQEYVLDATIPLGYTYNWGSTNGFTANTPAVTVKESGDYWVLVKSQPGCMARDTVTVVTDDREISASFLVSTQAYKGENVIIANVSFPQADSIKWNLPKNVNIISEDSSVVELSFPVSGKYTIGMMAYRGDCTAYTAKDLIVVDSVSLPGVNTDFESLFKRTVVRPNPNNGQFYVDVEVTADAAVNYRFVDITRNKTVYEKRSQLTQSALNTEAFNIPGLPAGVYVLLLETARERKALKVMIL